MYNALLTYNVCIVTTFWDTSCAGGRHNMPPPL